MAFRKRTRRTGAAAVEFAIAISILLVIVFASIEFFRLNMLRHSVEHASYLAARTGMIVGAKSQDVAAVAEQHLQRMQVAKASVSVNPKTLSDETQVIEVTIDVPVEGNSWVSPIYYEGVISGRTRMLAERAAADMAAAIPATP
ncbi:TadE/TadG family type IV pilus assembly protein [Novipirellula artificiosorum]|uniref:TadE-like protein n=1 Tax=Novipirellula artificiosorum TaxID=2528016 RepID=A0A5C6DGR6_9BACT|nr:TadE/TadG family type IV pilus assembly protein [Novipirellula artificiosorum]TWU35017.1 TadE-like protein [Novipirellula artificiosorum]